MKKVTNIILALIALATLTACSSICPCYSAKVIELPPQYRTPDGMAIGSDGNLYLSINQLTSAFKSPAAIARITKDDTLEDFYVFDINSPIGKVSPMGIVFAEGDIYVADNQMFLGKRGKSRILRLEIKDGKVVSCKSVVENLQISNGIAYSNGKIYLTDCAIDDESFPMKSAVYGFSIAELKSGKVITVEGLKDSHVVTEILTKHDGKIKFGADGIAFDKQGRMYVANLMEAQVLRFKIGADGKATNKEEILPKNSGLESADGLQFDDDGNLWIADFLGNAIAKCDVEKKAVTVVKKSPIPSIPNCGELDTPAEVFPRGDKLYISNMNMEIRAHKTDAFEAITVLKK